MKKCLVRENFSNLDFLDYCGVNIIRGFTPVILDEENEVIYNFNFVGCADIPNGNTFDTITEFNENSYLLIPKNTATIIYDIKDPVEIDKVIISGFFEKGYDFSLSKYEVYISNDLDQLFTKSSLAINYVNKNPLTDDGTRNNCDQVFELCGYRGRYIAVKILKTKNNDGIIRLSSLYVCNNDKTDSLTFINKTYGYSLISGLIPAVKGSYTADLSFLTDSKCFDVNSRVILNCETEYVYTLPKNSHISAIGIIGSYNAIENAEIYASNDKDTIISEENKLETDLLPHPTAREEVSASLLNLQNEVACEYIGIKFPVTEAFLDQIIVEGYEDLPIKNIE